MRKVFLSICFVVLCSSAAFGLDLMGPPCTSLNESQFGAGYEYSYSNMNIDIGGGEFGNHAGSIIKMPRKIHLQRSYAVIGYGIRKNWDAYLLLGSARNKAEFETNHGDTQKDASGDEFAWGFRTKMTWYEKDKLKFGGLYQMTWVRDMSMKKSIHITDSGSWNHTVAGTLNLTEIQVAIGPTYQLTERVSIYGGPFLHFINGTFSYKDWCSMCGLRHSQTEQVRQSSWFGGYIGTQIGLIKNAPICIEWQHTAFADAFTAGILWRH